MARFRALLGRPTGDILVLLIAGTICTGLVMSTISATVYAFVNPGSDLSTPTRYIADITNTLIGLLAGFLAGTTSAYNGLRSKHPPPPVATDEEDGTRE